MTTSMHTGFARVTVVAPRARVDVSLPQTATIADLLPQLLHLVGEDPADRDAAPSEWVLTRVGDTAVDTGRTVEALGVRDGEMLYLTPRAEEPPPPVFDDVAEAVAHIAVSKRGRWDPVATRRVGLVATLVLLLLGAGVVIGSGGGWIASLLSFGLVILLIGGGSALARAAGDAVAGAVLGGSALAYAFAGGLVLLLAPNAGTFDFGRAHLVVACAALTMFGVIGAAAIGDFVPLFLAAATAGGIGAVASVLAMVSGAPGPGVAAATAAVAIALTPMLPLLSLRLAGLTMPALPADATDFHRDEESMPEATTLKQTELGDEYLAAMLGAVSAVLVVCQVLLIADGSFLSALLCAVLAVALLLRSRVYPARGQRVALLVGSLVGGITVIVGLTAAAGPAMRLLGVLTSLVIGAGIALLIALLPPHKRRNPYWGRLLDIFEILVLLSIIPLALGVLELYQAVRGLSG